MKLHEHISTGQLVIQACEPGKVTINDQPVCSSCIVTPNKLLDWPLTNMADIGKEHLRPLMELELEIVLFGSGNRQQFPNMRCLLALSDRGIGFEVMDTHAACRTYNILMAEGRAVATALIINNDT
jgi:uncharacterized protein